MGLMSGTSLDGVDVAVLETDGVDVAKPVYFSFYPYLAEAAAQIRAVFGRRRMDADIQAAEMAVTQAHLRAIETSGMDMSSIDLIGFHGQTITHDPTQKFTWQIGDAQGIADAFGVPVAHDFRTADVAAGGQGAPLIPIYHAQLVRSHDLDLPVAVVNIGGVANISYVTGQDDDLLAFDCGPGNALLDDWVRQKTDLPFDVDGRISSAGVADAALVRQWLKHDYFARLGPKSLDRDAWNVRAQLQNMTIEDGAATLALFTVEAMAHGISQLPAPVETIILCGGGRANPTIRRMSDMTFECPVLSADLYGWNGDAIEAEGFAYLAARTKAGLPISFPRTTGVSAPLQGGRIVYPAASKMPHAV